MRIVLNLEATGWLGGRYYLQNLAFALREHVPNDVELLALGDHDPDFAELAAFVHELPEDADVVFPNWGLRGRTRAAQIHWIPDLQHRELPDNFGRIERLRRDLGYRRLGAAARAVVVSSDVARRDAATAYPRLARKLRVLHFVSAARDPAADSPPPLEQYGLPANYILVANQFWAHKNHETAFAALGELPLPVVCTGATEDHRRPDYVPRLLAGLKDGGHASRVHILGVVPRADYLALVAHAAAVLQPSLFEGWSSIVEDARAYGRPIALSDIAVHREQDPALASFFAPRDPAALARAVRSAVSTTPLPAVESAKRQRSNATAFAHRFMELAREAAGFADGQDMAP